MPGEELNTFLQKTLGDNYNNLPQLVEKLEELGVETIEDLKFLEVADLSDVLKPVQCRKFIQAIQLEGSSDSKLAAQPSREAEGPSQSGNQELLKANFNSKSFRLDRVISKMPGLEEQLGAGVRLQADARRQFVREVVDQEREKTLSCAKKQWEDIAINIVRKYPSSFENRIGNIKLGGGYESLLKQLVHRNENLNRTKNGQNALKGNGTESQSLSDLPIRKKRALIRDSYGCVNLGPSVSNDQIEEQDRQRIELKQWYGQENPDWDKVYSAMEATFPLQRKHINGGALLGQLFSD